MHWVIGYQRTYGLDNRECAGKEHFAWDAFGFQAGIAYFNSKLEITGSRTAVNTLNRHPFVQDVQCPKTRWTKMVTETTRTNNHKSKNKFHVNIKFKETHQPHSKYWCTHLQQHTGVDEAMKEPASWTVTTRTVDSTTAVTNTTRALVSELHLHTCDNEKC